MARQKAESVTCFRDMDEASGLIKKLRAAHNMTQKEFAERVGISKIYVSMIENGRCDLSLRTFQHILSQFGHKVGIYVEPAREQTKENDNGKEI